MNNPLSLFHRRLWPRSSERRNSLPKTPAEVTAIMEKVDLDHPWFLKLGETPKGNPLLRPGSGLLWTCPSPSRGPSRRSPSAGGRNEDAMSPPPIHRENQ